MVDVSVDVKLLSREDFDEIVKKGKAKGHTHIKFMRVGYCDRVVSLESVTFKRISNNLREYGVYAVRTGFPYITTIMDVAISRKL